MSYVDSKVRGGRDRQKQALIVEANQAGAQVHEIVELDAGQAGGGAVGGALTALFGGRMEVDAVHLLRLSTRGWGHAYVQPYSGFAPLPGEHYGVLTGSLASPAIAPADLRHSDEYPFDPARGPEVAQHLAASPAIKAVLRDLAWDWPTGMAKVELDWAVQLRSVGDGTTQVVMQAGRYGGMTTYEVGFGVWLRLCGAIHACLAPGAWPAQHFPIAPRYAGFLGAHSQAQAQAASDPVSVQIDYAPILAEALGPHLGNKVWLGEGPGKKAANIRKHVVPPELAGTPLLAGIDLTTFGSAKDAIVVTPTQLISKEFDDRLVVELATIQAVPEGQRSTAGAVEVIVDRLGTMRIPVGIDFAPVHALLTAIARANRGEAGPVHAEVSAFIGEAPGQLSAAEAQQLAAQARAAMTTGSVSDKINAAAQLLLGGQYQAAIDAYLEIAQAHPERTGTCYGQIGAGLFFIEQYARAIEYYEAAKHHGADPRMMDDNIAEARAKLG